MAVITTPKGEIKFEFYSEDAPNHVAAFIELAQKGFYDGTKFHRVEPNFVVQGGDPLSKTDDPMVGTGGPGYNLKAEFNSRQHLDGTVAMARSQAPDSAGSQFYICLGPQAFLDGNYTVFGQVVDGMDVVRSIAVGDVMEKVTIENASE
ncbi:MAG: peptidylprolyl isomerase [Actinomycetota bacterium]|nr:peptidylprolyl isomerase [Actinomycetota bacterium]MDZ4180983.1 peptidylprolyl isomerase [Coriobacteriia bacterium]